MVAYFFISTPFCTITVTNLYIRYPKPAKITIMTIESDILS